MSGALVLFRGLLAVVRHTAYDDAGQARTAREPMEIIFPRVTDHMGHPDPHVPQIHFHPASLTEDVEQRLNALLPERTLKYFPKEAKRDPNQGYKGFKLIVDTIELGAARTTSGVLVREDVGHESEEPMGNIGPSTCPGFDRFDTLSRLPNLNRLTMGRLMRNPPVVATVELSGGILRGIQSRKPLGRAFFDFFHKQGTVLVQQAVEDLLFECPIIEGHVNLTVNGETLFIKPVAGCPIIVDSFPLRPSPVEQTTLDHFRLFYELMDEIALQPFIRVACNCDKPEGPGPHPVKLTTPGGFDAFVTSVTFPNPDRPREEIVIEVLSGAEAKQLTAAPLAHSSLLCTEGPCSCLAAQVFD